MLSSIISVVIALYLSNKVKRQARYFTFPILLMVLLPVVAYVIFGTRTYLEGMTAEMVVRDMFSISGQSLSMAFGLLFEPIGMNKSQVMLGLVGWMAVLSGGIAFAQVISTISRDKERIVTDGRKRV